MTECDHKQPRGAVRKRRIKAEAKLKPMRFVSLHHHSTYSALDGFQLPDAHARRVQELGMSALAMTEHGNVSSHDKLEIAARQYGIKPIYGCELYTGPTEDGKRTQRKYHLTVIAKNLEGYANLLALVSRSWKEGFYYEPTVSWDMLREHRRGLVILSGCQGSLLFCSAVGGKLIDDDAASYTRARRVAKSFKRAFGSDYYIEVQAFPQLDKARQFNPMAETLGRELSIGIVATMDCHYTVPEEAEIQKVLHNVRGGHRQTLEDQVRDWGYTETLCPPTTDKSLYERLVDTGLGSRAAQEAIINTEVIAQGVEHYDLPILPMLRYPLPSNYEKLGSEVLFRDLLRQGWVKRGIRHMSKDDRLAYKDRLQREVDVITSKDFADYFLVVADAVRFAKGVGIPVGPARGSAAASLVCWLMRITEIDPMKFPQLVFERFIDISRPDLPDIDLDFDSERRHEVREYLVGKYGNECVSNIGTFGMYKPKVALNDVARVHKIPTWEVDVVKSALFERSSTDPRAMQVIEDVAVMFPETAAVFEKYPKLHDAARLEGNVRNVGVHPAGLVVSNGPISEVCAVYTREVAGVPTEVISLDKKDAERRGLIKMDFLGLLTMNVISGVLTMENMALDDLYKIPLDDEATIDAFHNGDIEGVFQFDGDSTRLINNAVKPDNFDEICDANALSRPGPLYSGATDTYIEVKHGRRTATARHPAYEQICRGTHGQIVYQEQILRIVREIGGFSWEQAAYVRKCISNKLGKIEFESLWGDLWEGAQRLHPDMTEQECRRIWDGCVTAGRYAFNFAHCVSYSVIAFWCMYFKTHTPASFYASSLTYMPKEKHAGLLRDAAARGIEILPPDPVASEANWRKIKGGKKPVIMAGFQQITGIGDKMAAKIIEYRDTHGLESWHDITNVRGVGPKKLESILEFVQKEDPFDIFWIDRSVRNVLPQIEQWGLPKPTHRSVDVPFMRTGEDTRVVWVGVITDRMLKDVDQGRATDRPDLRQFVKMTGYDGEEQVRLNVNRFQYPRFKDQIFGLTLKKDLVLVEGVRPGWRTAREIKVDRMWVIELDGEN